MQQVHYCHIHNSPVIYYDISIEDPVKKGQCILCVQKLMNNNNFVTIDQYQKKQQDLIDLASQEIDECSNLLTQLLQQISSYQTTLIKGLDKLMVTVKEQINLFKNKKEYFHTFLQQNSNPQLEILDLEYKNKQELQSQIKQQLTDQLIGLEKITNIKNLCTTVNSINCKKELTQTRGFKKKYKIGGIAALEQSNQNKEITQQLQEMETIYNEQQSQRSQICQRCYLKVQNERIIQISGILICNGCSKCSQCNKLNADSVAGAYFYHSNCVQLTNQTKVKTDLQSLIQQKLFATYFWGNLNIQNFEKFECSAIPNYQIFIQGQYNLQITQQQAYEYFLQIDFQQAETSVIQKFIQTGNKNVKEIPEKIYLLLTFAIFLLQEAAPLSNQFIQPNYKNLLRDLLDYKCKNNAQHNCTVTNKIKAGIDFFNVNFPIS